MKLFEDAAGWLQAQRAAANKAVDDVAREARARRDAAVARLEVEFALPNAPRKTAAQPQLRGVIREDPAARPRAAEPALRKAAGARSPYRYLVDPSKPENQGFLTTYANGDRSRSYINPYPSSNLGVQPWSDAELIDRMNGFAAGETPDMGRRITFVNDDPHKPSPYQPLTTPTARMAASAIWDSGVDRVNINSTTGGHAGPGQRGSRHNQARAVDINRVNGAPVLNGDPGPIGAVQDAFGRQPNIRENFGPGYQQKTPVPGGQVVFWPGVAAGHRNHIHASGQR